MPTRNLRLDYGDGTGPGKVGEILFWPTSSAFNTAFWSSTDPARIALKYNDETRASSDPGYTPEYTILGVGKYASVPVTVGATYGVDIIRINGTKDTNAAFTITIPAGATTLNISTLTPSPIVQPTVDQIIDAVTEALAGALDGKQDKATLADDVAPHVSDGSALDVSLAAKISSLKQWAKNPDQLVAGAVTYTSGLLSSAVVEWPDGKPGVLTIDSRQSGTDAVTAYHVTHVDGATTKTYTQPTITRDVSGNATLVPQITVA